VKRSLIISIVGMRPRMMRSWLVRLYVLTPPGSSSSFGAVSTSPDMTPPIKRIDFFLGEYLIHGVLEQTTIDY
jgi:hypothetical protein